jgi:hypothetical protein
VMAEEGRIAIWFRHLNTSNSAKGTWGSVGWQGPVLRYPNPERSLWVFDAHVFQSSRTGLFYLLAFPIWCALVPFLIPPFLWLWARRRRTRDERGFPVIANTASADSPHPNPPPEYQGRG